MRTLDEIYQDMNETLFTDMCSLDIGFFAQRVLGKTLSNFHKRWIGMTINNRYVLIESFRGCFTKDTIVLDRKGYPSLISEASNSWISGTKPVYRVFFKNGMNVKCTLNHEFFTDKGVKQLKDIDLDKDKISVLGEITSTEEPFEDVDFWKIIAYLNTDGYFKKAIDHHQSIKFTSITPKYISEVKELVSKKYANISMKEYIKGNGKDVIFLVKSRQKSDNPLRTIVDELDYDNNFPRKIFSQPKEIIAGYLNRVYSCDGSIYLRKGKHKAAEIQLSCGINEIYAKYYQLLLLKLGIRTILKHHKKKKEKNTQFDLVINSRPIIKKFFDNIGLIYGKEKQSKKAYDLSKIPYKQNYNFPEIDLKSPQGADTEKCYFTKIKKIEYLGEEEVWDMEVPNKGWYIADGIHVHNSGKTYTLGLVYPLWLSIFRPGSFVLFSASHYKQATKLLDEIKNEITNNEFLIQYKPKHISAWNEAHTRLSNGSEFYCKAYTKKIKGVHVNYAFIDEVQDVPVAGGVFDLGIMPTINKKKGHIVCVGVSDNPGDMVEELKSRKAWVSDRIPILTKDNKPSWPEEFTLEDIKEIKESQSDSWGTQYMLRHSLGGDYDVFPLRWINNCFTQDEMFGEPKYPGSQVIMGLDFAMSGAKRGDFDCYVVIEKVSGKVILRHGERHKGVPPESKIERIKYLYNLYNPIMMYADKSNIGEDIVNRLINEGYPIQGVPFDSANRNKMIVNLQSIMMPNKHGVSALVIPHNKEDTNGYPFSLKLTEELIGFKEKKSQATGITLFNSTAQHDDTVAALCLASFGASQMKEFVGTMMFG